MTGVSFTRRSALAGIAAAATLLAAPAVAVSTDSAEKLIREAVGEMTSLLTAPDPLSKKEKQFRALMDRFAAVPQIARFTLGATWRDLSPAQQSDFEKLFGDYIAHIYARRFDEYKGETIDVDGSIDAGSKGVLVKSTLMRSGGAEPVAVEWLVSDRSGALKINDIVIEGVSLAISQREEFASMLDARQNDVQKFFDDLRKTIDGKA